MSKTLKNDELPATVHGFVDGWQGRDAGKVEALFAEDAVVSDQGESPRGLDEIRAWINGSINLFTGDEARMTLLSTSSSDIPCATA